MVLCKDPGGISGSRSIRHTGSRSRWCVWIQIHVTCLDPDPEVACLFWIFLKFWPQVEYFLHICAALCVRAQVHYLPVFVAGTDEVAPLIRSYEARGAAGQQELQQMAGRSQAFAAHYLCPAARLAYLRRCEGRGGGYLRCCAGASDVVAKKKFFRYKSSPPQSIGNGCG